jgi:hypothetical protein
MTSSLVRVLALLPFFLAAIPSARAAWSVDEQGDCVRTWEPASAARGPTAVLNAPLVPFRSAAGGVQMALENKTPGRRAQVLLPPLLALAGGGMGLVESVIWTGTGLVDTVTGGYFEVAPSEATQLDVAPMRPAFSASTTGSRTDRCGRPLGR